jgi:hypothetical protein
MNLIEAQRQTDGAFVISLEAAREWASKHKIETEPVIDTKCIEM